MRNGGSSKSPEADAIASTFNGVAEGIQRDELMDVQDETRRVA